MNACREATIVGPRHILLLFVDGIGLPPGPLEESVYGHCPALLGLFREACVPIDPSLGISGIPQSATGQTAIFTGVNAAESLGHHSEGFPGPELRAIIESGNLFSRLIASGGRCTFANAYTSRPGGDLPMMFRSVTTVMTLHALGRTRNRGALLAGEAVYHDITREVLARGGAGEIPTVTERQAALHLLGILHGVDLCLFEFFLTDYVGHRGDLDGRRQVLASLDRFVAVLLGAMDRDHDLLLLVSDHGNIEDSRRRGHSTNPVPWIAVGVGSDVALAGMTSIMDVTPRILSLAGVPASGECSA